MLGWNMERKLGRAALRVGATVPFCSPLAAERRTSLLVQDKASMQGFGGSSTPGKGSYAVKGIQDGLHGQLLVYVPPPWEAKFHRVK